MRPNMLTIGGDPVTNNGNLFTHYFRRDTWNGTDGTVPDGITEGQTYNATYAPLEIRSNGIGCSDRLNNTNVGDQTAGYPYDAIGCAWADLGCVDVEATIEVAPLNTHYREATPLLHVTPGTGRHGVGAWLSSFGPGQSMSVGLLLVSYIANPASDFGDYEIATGVYTRPASTSYFTMRSVGGHVTCYLNGVEIAMQQDFGAGNVPIDYFTVDASLAASTMHGVALDNHFDYRPVHDAVTNGTTTLTSADDANFTSADVNKPIYGTNIPAGTTIASRTDAATVVLSQAATGSGSDLTVSIGSSTGSDYLAPVITDSWFTGIG